jgi:hypothetical protein
MRRATTPDKKHDHVTEPVDGRTGPKLAYWHVWTDADGVSRQTRCELDHFVSKSISPPAAPQWQDQLALGHATVLVTVQPVGWIGDWHENPKPQWIVPLTGRWFVETMDGTRVEMGPGEISFGEDQGTKPDAKGRRGHLSGTIGDAPAVLMIVQSHAPPVLGSPCRFK